MIKEDEKNILEVVGSGVDTDCLQECRRRKLNPYAKVLHVDEFEANEARAVVVVNTQEAQPAYEPANVRRWRRIQSIITILIKALFVCIVYYIIYLIISAKLYN